MHFLLGGNGSSSRFRIFIRLPFRVQLLTGGTAAYFFFSEPLSSAASDLLLSARFGSLISIMKTAEASLFSLLCKHKDEDSSSDDESEDLGDVLDSEVKTYLNTKEEAHYKKIIWEQMNKDYLQEQAAKKEGHDVVGAAAIVKKSKKRQRITEAPINKPAQAETDTTREILTKKRLSSKFNFDVLDKLFTDTPAPDSSKKQEASSFEENSLSTQNHSTNQLEEDLEGNNHVDTISEENAIDFEDEDPPEAYGNEYYDYENEEEYGYGYGDYGGEEED
ncbi:hypothetical protein SDJN03_14232, partial [Cucurbita argyrosperma subsp. sororia]